MKRAKFGRYFNTNGVPQIEVITPSGEVGYLSAFRRYAFQVSGTPEGQGDLGSSPVFGLEALTKVSPGLQSNLGMEDIRMYFTSLAAMDAVQSFCVRRDCYPPKNEYSSWIERAAEWRRFLQETLKFARHETCEEVPLIDVDAAS